MNALLYLTTILIWGTTWIAIHLQLGSTPVLTSVFFRFALAGSLLLPILLLCRRLQPTRTVDHLFFLLQGACLFSLNFICFYNAAQYVASGVISVVFSAATLYNAFNSWMIWKEKPAGRVYVAGAVGVLGLTLLFWRELGVNTLSTEALTGLGLAAVGAYFFSLGNMISVRHSRQGLTPLTSNAFAMLYGAAILLTLICVSDTPIVWDERPAYLYSLLYLAIPGSIVGFTAYLMLVSRIGANNAAYATVLFPVVALSLSSIYEGYEWDGWNIAGLILVLSGNLILQGSVDKIRKFLRARSEVAANPHSP
ncbi:DMT family transporter [Hahella sp. NBU794]|uniref:DMT family transporter n=1 Tax=Hahella sp. NBU794 TaxID=3422590 RepID=UPI003D6DAB07